MKIGPISISIHRTVRVAEGKTPANLPPSLGVMRTHNVKDYRDRCPASWEDEAVFVALHSTEALWLSFNTSQPYALLIGAGGINALTGEKLGTKLAENNYLVTPPQPWLDGWKDQDGTVYQFVGTEYKGGEGLTVGEQLIGAESKTGGIGIAVFEAVNPSSLKSTSKPMETWGESSLGDMTLYSMCGTMSYTSKGGQHVNSSHYGGLMRSVSSRKSMMSEMGVGKGGKITQKIYPDPYGLQVWKDAPVAVSAIYIVDAATCAEIIGETVSKPVVSEDYTGKWFGLDDKDLKDVAGSVKFTGLKSAAFSGDTSNITPAEPIAGGVVIDEEEEDY